MAAPPYMLGLGAGSDRVASLGSRSFPASGQRPFSTDSPWNVPIRRDAVPDARSDAMVATIAGSNNGRLRSDPTQFTFPIYFADDRTPRVTMTCTGSVSTNHADGNRTSAPDRRMPVVPIPSGAVPSRGSDAQMIIIDTITGDEYDIWRFAAPDRCTNITKYVQGVYRGAVEKSYISRGAGVPYLAGIVRPWEITQGRIEHALAFAYSQTRSSRCVWPASKTDGKRDRPDAIPEGARIQLDPTLDVNSISGLDATGRIIARALQQYGAYVVDTSGANKIYAEDNLTAQWGARVTGSTVSPIPVQRLRVLRLPDRYWAEGYVPNHGACVQ